MERQVERGCGLDVHRDTVAACVRIPGPNGKRQHDVRTFGTTATELLGLRDWLETTRMGELGRSSYIGTDWRRRERAILSQVIVVLAEELYARDHGLTPSSVDELVGPYLEHLPSGDAGVSIELGEVSIGGR